MSRKKTGFRPITVLLRQLQNAMRQEIDQALAESGLTAAQANALTELAYAPARSNAEIARLGHVTPQTMVEILLELERRGLVVRKTPDCGRAMLAELTDAGAKKVLAVHLAMRRMEHRVLHALPAGDLARLRQLLEGCLAGLDGESDNL